MLKAGNKELLSYTLRLKCKCFGARLYQSVKIQLNNMHTLYHRTAICLSNHQSVGSWITAVVKVGVTATHIIASGITACGRQLEECPQ